ncbi:MAG: hypothetical protein ACE5DK_02260 [Paracoccaceae bacterium]
MKQNGWIVIGAAILLVAITYLMNQQIRNDVSDQAASTVATALEQAELAKAASEAAVAAKNAAGAAQAAAESAAATASEQAAAARDAADQAAASAAAGKAAGKAAGNDAPAMAPPFGSKQDVAYAGLIWQAMLDQKLAGPDMLRSAPYEGTEPHGMMLELFTSSATIDGHSGDLIVKRNFGPEGVSAEAVLAEPEKHLGAITVMFRREAGFDPETKDLFWVKFLPDGSLDKNPTGMQLAGRVAKGMDQGCIACHSNADGDDFIFSDVTLQ